MLFYWNPMLSRVAAMTTIGMECVPVEVEVDVARGMPKFHIVGLADTAVQESRQRVFSSIKNSGMNFPPTKITVNLAPADTKKVGPLFDLPIAVGILMSSEQLPVEEEISRALFLGELALDGRLRRVTGVLPIVSAAKKQGLEMVFLPKSNAAEASLVEGMRVFGAETLQDVVQHLKGNTLLQQEPPLSEEEFFAVDDQSYINFSSIAGQEQGKRSLEIAAAGSHNVLMNGSPGSGKTFMAKAYPSILPRMTRQEAFEVSKIYSIAGLLPSDQPLIRQRPFRAVHHTASNISIVGGNKKLKSRNALLLPRNDFTSKCRSVITREIF